MRRQDHHKPNRSAAALTDWVPALIAVGIMLIGFFAMLVVLRLDVFRPRVGDMVVFRASSQAPDVWELQVPATQVSGLAGGSACIMNLTVMATGGGSLVVEARSETAPPVYRVHWAGQRTEGGPRDCGAAADLTVTRTDLQRLANAAGGFGIGDKGIRR